MSQLNLDHQHTPDTIRQLNHKVVALLSSDSIDEAQLLDLVNQRQDAVEQHHQSLPRDEQQAFAKLEYEATQALTSRVEVFFSDAKASAVAFVKAQKAVKKYR